MHHKAQNLARPLLMAALLSLAMTPALQAAPRVTGVVLNAVTGQPVRGAALEFEGTETAATSDLDGLILVELPAGSYTVVVTKEGFKPQKVTRVGVTAGGGNFAVALEPAGGDDGSVVSEEITVTAEAALATEEALLTERKNAVQISDSIGAQEISKTTGSDAAGVMQRVTGISLQDSKYVYVRGLGDRYSNTTLNGAKLPSTEFEKKVVPFDLFPTGLIEKITVSKSYTADKPGDFAAGFVELSTIDYPARRTGKIEIGGGWNSVTTGEELFEYDGGLSFSGGGGQALPSTVPDVPLVRRSPVTGAGFTEDELEAIGESIGGVWLPDREGSAPFDRGFKASYGQSAGNLGFVVSANYEHDWETRTDEAVNFYAALGEGEVTLTDNYLLDTTDDRVRQALAGNLSYRFGTNHHLQLKSVYTTLANAESRVQEGFFSDVANDVRDYRVTYQDQEVTSFQLAGDHYFTGGGAGSLFEWKLTSSEATTEENRRQVLYEEIRTDVYRLTDNAQSGFLYFNDLEDQLDDAQLHWTKFFDGGKASGSLKAGAAYTQNDREFVGRRLRFFQRGSFGVDLTLTPEELFVPDFIGPTGFEIQEVTRPTDTYLGDHEIRAGYLQGDVAWRKWRLVIGARVEDSNQEVTTFDRNNPDNPPIVSVIDDADVLPALNLVYALNGHANLRFSASRTVNRPEFRELAPFQFTHVVGGFAVTGNPDLVRAEITSYDARWEWFPSAGDVIAASLFYKDFQDPIENVLLAGAEFLETYQNVEKARNYGFELELRRGLGALAKALDDWSVVFNYAFVDSRITIDPSISPLTNAERALVGQPDNVFNAILEWSRPESGSLVRLLYNFTDDKVARAGGFGQPDVIEDARGTFDLVWGQALRRGFEFKLSGSNLFAEERLWSQGGEVFRLYDPGRSLSFSIAYKPWS
ncbi:MAG TPA: TonB-dependent receptor [Thermoanaerobaculia bacterium]